MATEQRPAVIPARAAPTTTVPPTARKPLPAGAVAWSQTYVDRQGLPQKSDFLVPVDGEGRRTGHVRHTCRGHIEIDGVKQGCDQVAWLLPADPPRGCPDHIVKLEPTEKTLREPLLPWHAIGRAVGPSARPWWVLAVNAAAGIGAYAGQVPWWSVAAATPFLAAGAWRGCRDYLTRQAVKRRSIEAGETEGRRVDTIAARARAAGYMTAGSGAWLTCAASTGGLAGLLDVPAADVAAVMAGLLAAGWAVGSATWWNHLERLRNRPQPATSPVLVEAKAATADELSAAESAKVWADEVALPGTKLDPATWQRIACGWQAVVVATKRGALNTLGGDNWKATERRLAAAFDVPRSAITWIEEYEGSPNKALLLVQPNNPLRDGQIWGGPELITVTDSRIVADVGALIDGNRMIETLFRFEEGMPSELVLGTTGSGKSERLRLSLAIQRWASYEDPVTGRRKGLFLSFLHDPKRLNSYGEFRDAVHGYGITRDDAHMMADAFLREMVRRYDLLRTLTWVDDKGRERVGSVKWDPRIHGALLKCIWDEFHELAADTEFVKKLEKLARYQRACGMGATLASHMGTLGDTGSQALRDMLSGGRASLLRTTSGLNASLATGGQLTGDPRALPKDPGMCLVADGETATLMGRYSYIPDDRSAAKLGERPMYDWLFDDNNQPIGFPAEIPAETAEAFGKEFMEWMEAGRRPEGRESRASTARPLAAGVDLGAPEALRQILFASSKPVGRDDIVASPLWAGRSATSTLTGALRAGQDAGWIVKQGMARSTTFELSPVERERLQVGADEMAEAR